MAFFAVALVLPAPRQVSDFIGITPPPIPYEPSPPRWYGLPAVTKYRSIQGLIRSHVRAHSSIPSELKRYSFGPIQD